ncbi:MAG: type II toxin-antitoxin system VapB family antitoxin [Novosphingobium sp.]
MNDMTRLPRHKQKPITIRSDTAARLLKELTRDGRSQAQVIEDALAEVAAQRPRKMSSEEFNARIDAIVQPLRGLPKTTYRELREQYYDENGLPR